MISTLKKKLNKKGFTLAELLIVIAIIAVLVAIAVPVFSSQLENSRISVDKSTARSANSIAVANYLMFEGTGTVSFNMAIDADGNIGVVSTTVSGTGNSIGTVTPTVTAASTFAPQSNKLKTALGSDDDLVVVIKNGVVDSNTWMDKLG